MTEQTHPCGHPAGCDQPATHQYPRPATETEAAAYWDGLEQWIRAHGTPEYVQDRSGQVAMAEHRCDHPEHAHPAHLAAVQAAKAAARSAAAMAEGGAAIAAFTPEQIRQLTDLIRSFGQESAHA